jgi:hypothetical protein
VSQTDPLTPVASGEGEFEIIGPEGKILDRRVYALGEQLVVAVDIFRNAEPESEELGMGISDVLDWVLTEWESGLLTGVEQIIWS